MDIIVATKNLGKIKEIKKILTGTAFTVKSMEEVGLDVDVIEDGETFEENSLKKAIEIMKLSKTTVLSDDSGLEIDYLDKKPGVYSARFLGENTSYTEKNRQVLDLLRDVPDFKRTARFISVVTVAFPDGQVLTAKGTLEGKIAYEAKGNNGFGYDPIFYVPEYGMALAEMNLEQKNIVSHRGKAMEMMKVKLMEALGNRNENISSE